MKRLLPLVLLGCATAQVKLSPAGLGRVDFNRAAAERGLPLFWIEDADRDGAISPAELAVIWGFTDTSRADWVADGVFTARFDEAYRGIAEHVLRGPSLDGLSPEERTRRALVLEELRQGRPTLIQSRFTAASDADRAIVRHILDATRAVERIYLQQRGAFGYEVPQSDPASRTLFYRNQGPWCAAPATEKNPDCSALPTRPPRISGVYPATIQGDPKFCEALEARPDNETILGHFNIVTGKDLESLAVEPYHRAYAKDMEAAAKALEAAAAITDEKESAFAAYLLAAATAFRTNQWEPADEAWSRMNVHNSKWYLRIGPDETYFEPCSAKAGFHVSFGLINQDSLEWQNKLDPVKGELEKALAALAGPPYAAREVSFHLPDFIEIVLNAGDSRSPSGATIGQSLPNWGPVANEGRGRTVAMTNFYTDPDSQAAERTQVESLFCKSSLAAYSSAQKPRVMSTVLHEAAHNLGPSHEYRVDGKTDDQAFGGPLAATLEELKAQTAALYFTDWLVEKKLIDRAMAEQAHTYDIVWGFGHISRGMYSDTGKPKPYSQLAAIQLGALIDGGAIRWDAEQMAANGTDRGCFALDLAAFPKAIDGLAREVMQIKGGGLKARAEALVARHVDAEEAKRRQAIIAERWLRSPKATFVYAIEL